MSRADWIEAVVEARVRQRWLSGQAAPIEALRDPMVRRRLLTQALEARVIRLEVARRGLAPTPEALAIALESAARGEPLEPRDQGERAGETLEPAALTAPPAALDARLAARFSVDPARVRQVVVDVLCQRLLVESLLDEASDSTLRAAWLASETWVKAALVRVPRVPTSREIDEAVRTQRAEIRAYHAGHRSLFHTPARAMVRVILKAVGPLANDAARAAARQAAEDLRQRALAGEPFEALARAESDADSARRGGAIGAVSRQRLPEAFEIEIGAVSAVRSHPKGWMIFQVDRRLPEIDRPLTDERVQREIAATLLRKADRLPDARGLAEQARQALESETWEVAVSRLAKAHRIRRSTTPLFARTELKLVPGLGLAPALFDALFDANSPPVSAVFRVRQEYVVARRLELRLPDPRRWPDPARAAFVQRWRARQRPVAIQQWLNRRLKGQPLWVDDKQLAAISLEDVTTAR